MRPSFPCLALEEVEEAEGSSAVAAEQTDVSMLKQRGKMSVFAWAAEEELFLLV